MKESPRCCSFIYSKMGNIAVIPSFIYFIPAAFAALIFSFFHFFIFHFSSKAFIYLFISWLPFWPSSFSFFSFFSFFWSKPSAHLFIQNPPYPVIVHLFIQKWATSRWFIHLFIYLCLEMRPRCLLDDSIEVSSEGGVPRMILQYCHLTGIWVASRGINK
jgi:hypothetical protein